MNVLHEGLADTKYRPCPLLPNMWKLDGSDENQNEAFMITEQAILHQQDRLSYIQT